MNAGPDPDGFLDFFTRELAEPVRALTPSAPERRRVRPVPPRPAARPAAIMDVVPGGHAQGRPARRQRLHDRALQWASDGVGRRHGHRLPRPRRLRLRPGRHVRRLPAPPVRRRPLRGRAAGHDLHLDRHRRPPACCPRCRRSTRRRRRPTRRRCSPPSRASRPPSTTAAADARRAGRQRARERLTGCWPARAASSARVRAGPAVRVAGARRARGAACAGRRAGRGRRGGGGRAAARP